MQKRVDLRKAVLRTSRDATVLLAGILAGAVAAYGVATPDDDLHSTAQPTQTMAAPEVAAASAAALDGDSLRAAASFGHALVAVRGAQAAPDRTSPHETPAEGGCSTASAPRTYVLVDPMLVPQGRAQLARLARQAQLPIGAVPLALTAPGMASAGDERSTQFLPWLIELPEAAGPREALARLTMSWARDHHGAVWVLSACSIDGLAVVLGRAMVARLDDGSAAVLRLADARVLHALRDVLDPGQQQALWGLAAQWRYVDRSGHLQTIEASQTQADHLGRRWQPLVFSAQQTTELLQAAEPDEVLSYVGRLAGDRLNAMTSPERHAFATRQIAAAKPLGMHSSQEIGLFAALALKAGDDFLAQAPWQLALEQVRQGERSWVQVLTSDESQR